MKINWNKNYFKILLYACAIVAITVVGLAISLNLGSIADAITNFLYILTPVFFGLAIAYFVNPLLNLVEKKFMGLINKTHRPNYIKHLFALLITYLLVLIIVVAFGFLIFPELIKNFDSIINNLSTNVQKLYDLIQDFVRNTFKTEIGDLSSNLQKITDYIINNLGTISSSFGRFMFNFGVGLFLSFFVLLHKTNLKVTSKRGLAAILPRKAYNFFTDTVKMADEIFGQFFIGKVFDSLIIGVIMLAVLGIFQLPFFPEVFHIPYFLLISAIICITNIIPYIGPILGAIPSVLLVFIDDEGGFIRAIILLAFIILIQILDANVVGPRVLGKSVGISSLWVVVSIIVLGSLFGMFGMFIAVPLFTVIYRLLSKFTNRVLKNKQLSTNTEDYAVVDGNIPEILHKEKRKAFDKDDESLDFPPEEGGNQ